MKVARRGSPRRATVYSKIKPAPARAPGGRRAPPSPGSARAGSPSDPLGQHPSPSSALLAGSGASVFGIFDEDGVRDEADGRVAALGLRTLKAETLTAAADRY